MGGRETARSARGTCWRRRRPSRARGREPSGGPGWKFQSAGGDGGVQRYQRRRSGPTCRRWKRRPQDAVTGVERRFEDRVRVSAHRPRNQDARRVGRAVFCPFVGRSRGGDVRFSQRHTLRQFTRLNGAIISSTVPRRTPRVRLGAPVEEFLRQLQLLGEVGSRPRTRNQSCAAMSSSLAATRYTSSWIQETFQTHPRLRRRAQPHVRLGPSSAAANPKLAKARPLGVSSRLLGGRFEASREGCIERG